jgi:hypothetical protein
MMMYAALIAALMLQFVGIPLLIFWLLPRKHSENFWVTTSIGIFLIVSGTLSINVVVAYAKANYIWDDTMIDWGRTVGYMCVAVLIWLGAHWYGHRMMRAKRNT